MCWIEKSGKWFASIKKDRIKRRQGYFSNEIAAAQAYDEAARELFGEHAWLNFPDGIDAYLESSFNAGADVEALTSETGNAPIARAA